MKCIKFCLVLLALQACYGQQEVQLKEKGSSGNSVLGGPFENRDLFFEGMPKEISSLDSTHAWRESKDKLVIRGQVLNRSGKEAVPNVIIYYYHTDSKGYYSGEGPHGSLRGWVKSDKNGHYEIKTARPAAYPSGREVAHIHLTVLEDGLKIPYYIDNIVFDDDGLLSTEKRKALNNRGGSGIVRIHQEKGINYAERDIILGLNIENHPANKGLGSSIEAEVGEVLFSFNPEHVYGPDVGSRICPICKYGRYLGLAVFLNKEGITNETLSQLSHLNVIGDKFKENLRIFVYISEDSERILSSFRDKGFEHLGLAVLNSKEAEKNRFLLPFEESILIYKHGRIIARMEHLDNVKEIVDVISKEID